MLSLSLFLLYENTCHRLPLRTLCCSVTLCSFLERSCVPSGSPILLFNFPSLLLPKEWFPPARRSTASTL